MTFVITALGTIPKGLEEGLEDLEIRGKKRLFRLQLYQDRPEYWEESWGLKETCHSNSSEKPSANAGVKKLLKEKFKKAKYLETNAKIGGLQFVEIL